MTSVLTLSSVIGHGALTALWGHPLLGPRTVGCGYKSRRVILWTDGSELGARSGTPLYHGALQRAVEVRPIIHE
eukprot:6212854-Prymnesium_polylepis.1